MQTTDDAVEDGQDNTKAEKKKQKQIEWATSLNIDNIRMNPDKSSIVAIGGQDFNKITIAILIVSLKKKAKYESDIEEDSDEDVLLL